MQTVTKSNYSDLRIAELLPLNCNPLLTIDIDQWSNCFKMPYKFSNQSRKFDIQMVQLWNNNRQSSFMFFCALFAVLNIICNRDKRKSSNLNSYYNVQSSFGGCFLSKDRALLYLIITTSTSTHHSTDRDGV